MAFIVSTALAGIDEREVMSELCIHGGLKRKCETCDLSARLCAAEVFIGEQNDCIRRLQLEITGLKAAEQKQVELNADLVSLVKRLQIVYENYQT